MDPESQYEQEHRREPRIALGWRATVRSGDSDVWRCTTVNVSEAGVCVRSEFPPPIDSSNAQPRLLELSLPTGKRLEIEVVPVWAGEAIDTHLSGWRFTRVARQVRRTLREELGLGMGHKDRDPHWDEDEVDLWDHVKVLIRRRWLIAGCTLLTTIAAYSHAAMQPKLYTAEAQVFSVGDVDYLSLQERLTTAQVAPFVAVLESLPLTRRMVHKTYTIDLGDSLSVSYSLADWSVLRRVEWNMEKAVELLAQPSEPTADRQREAGGMGWLRSMAEFEHGKDGVLTIRSEAEFPDLAAQIANGYVEELGAYQLQTSTANTQRNLSMAKARMDTLQRGLRSAQRSLEVYKVANQNLLRDMIDVNLLMPEVGTRLDSLQRELDLKKRLYTTVAEQFELLRLQREKEATGLEVLSNAEPPLGPQSKTRKHTLLGAVLGFFLGIVGAFVAEYVASKRAAGELAAFADAWREDVGRVRRWQRR
jgi:uncharacterized protein involved in exopolysaccharide biosynthesis